MLFIGDVHGAFKTYHYVLLKMLHSGGREGIDCSLQLGDMGLGFPFRGDQFDACKDDLTWLPPLPKSHKFIRGNHDKPDLCDQHPNYIGDWGYHKKSGIFYVGGGFSIDYIHRTKDISWWENEQLSNRQLGQMMRSYKKNKPRIVVSHECPLVVKYDVVTNQNKKYKMTRTEIKFQEMFETHRPKYWIFGHHHIRKNVWIGRTQFVALGELLYDKPGNCIFEIEGLTWDGQKIGEEIVAGDKLC